MPRSATQSYEAFGDMNGPLGYWGPPAPSPQAPRAEQPAPRPLRLESAVAALLALVARAKAA